MKPFALIMIIIFTLPALAWTTCAESPAISTIAIIDPLADDPAMRSVECIAMDGSHVYLGVMTGQIQGTYGSVPGYIMVYDTSGRFLTRYPAIMKAGQTSTIIPQAMCVDNGRLYVLNDNLIVGYDGSGSPVFKQSLSKFDMGSAGSYNSTVSITSDGEYFYIYKAETGLIQKISKKNNLTAEYFLSKDAGQITLRGNEVWASDPNILKKTVVLSSDLQVKREFPEGVSYLALYDDKLLTVKGGTLSVRDTDFKVIKSASPLPQGSSVRDMASADGKAAVIGYIYDKANSRTSYKIYLYDLTQMAPRGSPVPSFSTVPDALKASPDIVWYRTYDGPGEVTLTSIAETGEGYVIAGYAIDSAKRSKPYIVKTNKAGEAVWEKALDGHLGALNAVIATDDGYLMAGYAVTDDKKEEGYIVKIGPDGNIIWEGLYGDAGNERLSGIVSTGDGGCVAAGYSASADGKACKVYIVNIDKAGNVRFESRAGPDMSGAYATGNAVVRSQDGGFVTAGLSNVRDNKLYVNHTFLVKVDENGQTVWQKRIDTGGPGSYALAMVRTMDGGYAIAGGYYSPPQGDTYTVNTDAQILKTDSKGNLEWGRRYDGIYNDGNSHNMLYSLSQTIDGGYVLTGSTLAPKVSGKTLFQGTMLYALKTDHQGILQWRKYIDDVEASKGLSVLVNDDGDYMVAGTAGDDGYLVELKGERLTTTASPFPTVSQGPSVNPSTNDRGGGCCVMALLPLILAGCAFATREIKRRN